MNIEVVAYTNIALEAFGIFICLILIVCLLISESRKTRLNHIFIGMLSLNSMVLLCDAITFIMPFMPVTHASISISRTANFFVYALGYVILALFTDYIVTYISNKSKISRKIVHAMWVLCAVAVGLVVLSQINNMYYYFDENNVYHRQSMYWLSQVWAIILMLVNSALIIKHRKSLSKQSFWILLSYELLPVIAMAIQIMIYGLTLLYISTTLSMIIIYVGIQVEQARQLKQQELELTQSRVAVMLSQIQPHFLYNSLAAIQRLCTKDPKLAEEAVIQFSIYLRGNMDSLTYKKNIPFEKELVHLENYLALEKKRFGDKLNIVYDVSVSNFYLPALTIQPIAENAVRHGITKRDEESGTLTISTSENETDILITVTDDGVGFDTSKTKDDGRQHIGIENVRNRIASMCGGTITIHSELGVGTTAIIKIPKGDL